MTMISVNMEKVGAMKKSDLKRLTPKRIIVKRERKNKKPIIGGYEVILVLLTIATVSLTVHLINVEKKIMELTNTKCLQPARSPSNKPELSISDDDANWCWNETILPQDEVTPEKIRMCKVAHRLYKLRKALSNMKKGYELLSL